MRIHRRDDTAAFTLVEVLLSLAVLSLILVLTLSMTGNVASLLKQTRARIDTFQEARVGFEAMNRRISQAMLNTYWDYEYKNQIPTDYRRQSELHFISGPTRFSKSGVPPLLPLSVTPNLQTATHGIFFQAPSGFSTPSAGTQNVQLSNILNTSGYYTEYASNSDNRPKFLKTIIPGFSQFRLIELNVPGEKMETYQAMVGANRMSWFQNPVSQPTQYKATRVLAENILALVIHPQLSPMDAPTNGIPIDLAPDYYYDSKAYLDSPTATNTITRNQLPPLVQVTMVAIDQESAQRLIASESDPSILPTSLGLDKLFLSPTGTDNTDPGRAFKEDLKTLQQTLLDRKLNARVYTTTVSILQAKWSEQ